MFALIGNTLKYSGLVLLVLILSHIVEIKGVSISRHVERAMSWFASTPKEVTRVTQELSSSVHESVSSAVRSRRPQKEMRLNSEFTVDDQRELNRIIEKNQRR
jgi:hypothetical protein